jgi:hypothetical protein
MIKKVTVKYFKQFKDQTFELREHIILAGPNNSGKSALLQAVVVWNLAMRQWLLRRKDSKAKERRGVPITRKDFTALPLREMGLLWTDTLTGLQEPLFVNAARKFLEDELPKGVYRDPGGDHEFLINTPASKTLLPEFFKAAQINITKEEYYLIAEVMNKDDIPSEVIAKLDAIAEVVL